MARDVTNAAKFEPEPENLWDLPKEKMIVRCDDGTVYDFERVEGRPNWRLTHAIQPNGEMTHTGSRKILPDSVEDVAETLLRGWEA